LEFCVISGLRHAGVEDWRVGFAEERGAIGAGEGRRSG
jgi:hypothetical protein